MNLYTPKEYLRNHVPPPLILYKADPTIGKTMEDK